METFLLNLVFNLCKDPVNNLTADLIEKHVPEDMQENVDKLVDQMADNSFKKLSEGDVILETYNDYCKRVGETRMHNALENYLYE